MLDGWKRSKMVLKVMAESRVQVYWRGDIKFESGQSRASASEGGGGDGEGHGGQSPDPMVSERTLDVGARPVAVLTK